MRSEVVLEAYLAARVLADKTRVSYRDSARLLPKEWPESLEQASVSIQCLAAYATWSKIGHITRWRTLGRFGQAHLGIKNPFELVRKPRIPQRPRRIFTPDEYSALWNAATGPIDRALLDLVLGTGIRVGEIPLYHWQFSGDILTTSPGKTGERVVAVERDVRDAVLATGDGNRLWISKETGQPVSVTGLMTRWRRLIARSGLQGPRKGLHTARHTFADAWIDAGGDIRTLQGQLGHRSLETTQIYLQMNIARQLRELQRRSPLRRLKRMSGVVRPEARQARIRRQLELAGMERKLVNE